MKFTSKGLLVQDYGKLKLMSDGQNKVWEETLTPIFVDEERDLIVGYRSTTAAKLRGIKISTGEELWVTKSPHTKNWGWGEMQIVSDSLMMVANDDVDFINMYNGQLVRFDTSTGRDDAKAILLQSLAGVAFGMAGGLLWGVSVYPSYYYYVPYTEGNVIAHTCSNILKADDRYYLSDRKGIACYNNKAEQVWRTDFDHSDGAMAQLSFQGGNLSLLNFGLAFKNGGDLQKSGKPFYAEFDPNTGKMITKNDLELWDMKKWGKTLGIPYNHFFTFRRSDDATLTPMEFGDNNHIVITKSGNLLVMDNQLKVTEQYNADNYYTIYHQHGNDYVIGTSTADYWVVDKQGKAKMHFTQPVCATDLQGDILYLISGDRLFWVNLSE